MSSHDTSTNRLRTAFRRFSTLVILCVIVGAAAAAALSYRNPASYSGAAVYLVPPAGSQAEGEALTPFDAERVARTYSVVLREDEQILRELGAAVGRTDKAVAGRMQSVTLPASSAIRVTYRGHTRAEVRTFFDTLTGLIQQSVPVTENLRPNTLRLLQGPQDIARSGGGTPAAPIAGGIAGLLLGLAGAALLTRADPRVEDGEDLREPGGPSIVEVDTAQDTTVEALAIRMLDGTPGGSWVAVVGTTDRDRALAETLTVQLEAATAGLVTADALPGEARDTRWLPASLGGGRGERAAQDADRTMLVVPTGAALRDVASRLADLRDLGVGEVVIALVRNPGATRKRDATAGV